MAGIGRIETRPRGGQLWAVCPYCAKRFGAYLLVLRHIEEGHVEKNREMVRENEEPTFYEVKGGWHAQGRGWAVFGKTQADALAAFIDAQRLHAIIDARPMPPDGDYIESLGEALREYA